MARRKHGKIQQLEIDLDTRMTALMLEATGFEREHEWNTETVLTFMRASYGKGYADACIEAREGEPEKLLNENGYVLTRP